MGSTVVPPVDQGPDNQSVENLKRNDLHGTQGYPVQGFTNRDCLKRCTL